MTLMLISDAAVNLGVSKRTVLRYLKAGRMERRKHQVVGDIENISMAYIKISEAAKMFGVSYTFLLNKIHAGEIEAIRIGPKLIRIKIQSVRDYIENSEL